MPTNHFVLLCNAAERQPNHIRSFMRMDGNAPTSRSRLKSREPGLDLLRSLAITMVVIFHMPRQPMPRFLQPIQDCGWIGVDLFFVLSGYLIGSQLLRPYTRNKVPSIRIFFVRRALRVLPAFLVVLLVYFLFPGFREQSYLPNLWRFLTFTQNFGLHAPAAFSHAWSLCVEEHFYLILPLLVLWLMREPKFWKAFAVALSVFFGGLLIRYAIWANYLNPIASAPASDQLFAIRYWSLIYFPTYARLDGLLVGVGLAAVKLFQPVWWNAALSKCRMLLIASLITIGAGVWITWDLYAFHAVVWGFPLIALGFGFLVLASFGLKFHFPGATTGATLAYSIYLTHKEVMHLDRTYFGPVVAMNGGVGFAIYAMTILGCGGILYLFVERPFLQLRDQIIPLFQVKTSASKVVPSLTEF